MNIYTKPLISIIAINLLLNIFLLNQPLIASSSGFHIEESTYDIKKDSLQLVHFYHSTGGENWVNNSGWLETPITAWHGVSLNQDGTSIEKIELQKNNLTGNIPNLHLLQLTSLNLEKNKLTGTIPCFTLPNLTSLNLANNQLSGKISNLNTLTKLKILSLQKNQFTFDDLENTINYFKTSLYFQTLNYTSQNTIPIHQQENTIYVNIGKSSENQYAWYKNGALIESLSATNSLDITESGFYYLRITNNHITNETITGQNLILESEELFIVANTCSSKTDGIIWVTTTEDNGKNEAPIIGSLRAAILCANNNEGANLIQFDTQQMPHTNGIYSIKLKNTLPPLLDSSTIIDGAYTGNTKEGYIELDGTGVLGKDKNNSGFTIAGNNCEIYGFYIHNFPNNGIQINSSKCRIGSLSKENIISGNKGAGINIQSHSDDIIIEGNKIGTNTSGTKAFPNQTDGINITSNKSGNIQILSNIISGNLQNGINGEAKILTIKENKIGTDITGKLAIENKFDGIKSFMTQKLSIINNLISGNLGYGINADGIKIIIQENNIGTDSNQTIAIGNKFDGINIHQGSNIVIEKNIVANNKNGVSIFGKNYGIRQNSIYCNKNKGINTTIGGHPTSPPTIVTSNTELIGGTANPNDTIEVFINKHIDCQSIFGQGRIYLGTAITNSEGNWFLSKNSFPTKLKKGDKAIATAHNHKTSEFSASKTICTALVGFLTPDYACNNIPTIFSNISNHTTTFQWLINGQYHSSNRDFIHTFPKSGIYKISLITKDESFCNNIYEETITVFEDCILPGDFNKDGIVTSYDLLSLGLHFNETGHARKNASLEWLPQPSSDWKGVAENGINLKHVDGDGNGELNIDDLIAINKNYNEAYQKTPNVNGTILETLQLTPIYDNQNSNQDTIYIDLNLTTTDKKDIPVYGIDFTIAYETSVEVLDLKLNLINSWLGTINKDIIAICKHRPKDKEIDIAITRINHNNKVDSGNIGALEFLISNVPTKDDAIMKLNISNVKIIQHNEKVILGMSKAKDFILQKNTFYRKNSNQFSSEIKASKKHESQITENQLSLKVTPNPFSNQIIIKYQLPTHSPVTIKLYDAYGRMIKYLINHSYQIAGNHQFRLTTAELAPGIYLFEIETKEQLETVRVVKIN